MRKTLTILTLLSSVLAAKSQNIGININGTAPNASALLDIDGTGLPANGQRGLLIPRVALTATNAAAPVTTPATVPFGVQRPHIVVVAQRHGDLIAVHLIDGVRAGDDGHCVRAAVLRACGDARQRYSEKQECGACLHVCTSGFGGCWFLVFF